MTALTAPTVWLPLGRRQVLEFTEPVPGAKDLTRAGNENLARQINTLLAARAHIWVVRHPDDEHRLNGRRAPDPDNETGVVRRRHAPRRDGLSPPTRASASSVVEKPPTLRRVGTSQTSALGAKRGCSRWSKQKVGALLRTASGKAPVVVRYRRDREEAGAKALGGPLDAGLHEHDGQPRRFQPGQADEREHD